MNLHKISLALSLVVGGTLYAQNSISTVAPFLNIVTDARAAAMGDVGVATQADGSSMFHNASKMVFQKNEVTLGLNYTPWLRNLTDDIYIGNVTYQKRYSDRGAYGVGIKYFNYGEVQLTDESNGNIGTGNPYELAVEGSYALKLSNNYSMGVGLRYIRTDLSIAGSSLSDIRPSNGFAVDVSGYYKSDEMAFKNFNGVARGGFNISNLGPKLELIDREGFLPTNLKIGGGFDFILDDYNQLGVTTEFTKLLVPAYGNQDVNFISGVVKSFSDAEGGFKEEMQEVTVGLGAEYTYNNSLFIRGGMFKENPNKGNRNFYTLGAGFKFSSFNFDVSYLTSNSLQTNPLENTLRISFVFDLGDLYAE